MRLEQLESGLKLKGIIPNQVVTIIDVTWHGDAVEIIYKRADGRPDTELLYRTNESSLEIVEEDVYWHTKADNSLLRVVSEAYRIHLAHLFDPRLAVHTSLIEPLPHQITAVYGEMIPRQPLRFLLADDPGAGKTIMAGLFIKELIVRGDVRRCLICAPGSLTEQWQDELWTKFQLRFEILTRDKIEASHTGNPFQDYDRMIIRLDQVARDDDLKISLQNSDWDLIICDEAHKMSASFFGNELKETKRYKLGKTLSSVARHFLLMTATPHNGKEEDFQLFMALLDQDRFEGRFRDGAHVEDTSDLMRRMVKEDLLKFDGRPLFPERRAYTVSYNLSADEEYLYQIVTEYVREEFNRAEQLQNGGRRGTVGFALTILQRRLASSPEAIYQSLSRRRKKLEKRLQEAKHEKRLVEYLESNNESYDDEYLADWEEFPDEEFEELEIELADNATAARTIQELEAEILTLQDLEKQARDVRNRGNDRKWAHLAGLMQEDRMFTPEGSRRKIVIFTEHRDTLNYLHHRLSTLLGNPNSIVTIHGGIRRTERLDVEDRFRNDPSVHVLLATDAAGEGINLQRAHLMVNYDLPWNPNRLEQRFGRIHRIGQEEVCHLWNLVAGQTREGQVYQRLLEKIQVEKGSLDGKVFDVLGKLFDEQPLRKLLVDAIRYGDQPEVRARLEQAVDNAMDQERVRTLLEQHSLAEVAMDTSQIERVRAEMERAAAQRLQPYYIKAFFMSAFEMLGGTVHEREPGRYQINHVPAIIRDIARDIQGRGKVQKQYERICFDKSLINMAGKPRAEFVCPGHLFLDAIIDLIARRHNGVLKQGAVLIDPHDPGEEPRALFYLEHALRDASDDPRVISRAVQFVEVTHDGQIRNAGSAPYLDYRAPNETELARIETLASNLPQQGAEQKARSYAISQLAPRHLDEVRERREDLIDKTLEAVHKRLTKEINYWDKRAVQLKEDARAGKRNAKVNWQRAQQRADELAERLETRKQELEAQRQIAAAPPVIVGRALIIPIGMLLDEKSADLTYRRVTEQIAMRAVMEAEIALGNHPRDVSAQNVGYDIESRDGNDGRLRFIEVKCRRSGADTVTLTYNELHLALNSPEQFILALVEAEGANARPPRYLRDYPFREPDPSAFSVNFDLGELLARTEEPY
jgi:superfamily II DNA or RNA helicase